MITWPQILGPGEIGLLRAKTLSIFFILFTLLSCTPPSDSNQGQEADKTPPVGLGQVEDLSYRLGVDSDKSGIRDDVQEWIESLPYERYIEGEHLKKALIHLSRAYQQELGSAHELSASREATHEVIKAIDCLYSLIGPEQGQELRNELRDRTYDSARRKSWREIVLRNFESQPIADLGEADPKKLCPWMGP